MTDAELYPEHEKLRLVKDTSQAIYDFIDWLEIEHQIKLCQWMDSPDPTNTQYLHGWYLMPLPLVNLLAQYFGIDQTILEAEKRAILDALRASAPSPQAGPGPGSTTGPEAGPGSLVTAPD